MNIITEKVKKHKNASWLLIALFVGVLLGYWLKSDDQIITQPHSPNSTNDIAVAEPLASSGAGHSHMTMVSNEGLPPEEPADDALYVCPMMCVPPQDNSGDCPICGMELIATPAGEKDGPPRLKLAPETVKLAQIQTAPVVRQHVSAEVRLFGQIEYDPVHISYSSAYVPGMIDRIYVKRAGQAVRWGDPLFDIYSPEIFMIEEQMMDALAVVPGFYELDERKPHVRKRSSVIVKRPGSLQNATEEQKEALDKINAMRLKLTLIGMEKKDIDELMKKGEPSGIATIYAQRSGTVIEQNAFEGTYVNTGTPVFAIANPKFVWARLEAYESDYPWIRIGQEATFVTDTYPGETFKGKVAYVDPIFNTQTRTFDVGVIFPDSGRKFRPSMYVRAVVNAKLGAGGKVMAEGENHKLAPLVIPDTAPLITGKRAVVYVAVADEEGVYEGREILLGPRAKNTYVVVDGLKEGEQVVVNGNFKIDSQVQVMAKSSMMTIEGGHSADAHHHHGGSEVMETNGHLRMPVMESSPKMDMNSPMKTPSRPASRRGGHKHQGQ